MRPMIATALRAIPALLFASACLAQPAAKPTPPAPGGAPVNAPVQASAITTKSLLEELIDRDAIARFPSPAFTAKQFSSYDRASVTPESAEPWFANRDHGQFLRIEKNAGREERVMMDVDGPGAIVRLWSANPDGILRVYLDNKPEPVIEAPMKDVLSGKWKIDPPLSGVYSNGANLYFPIPYATHCKVTSDNGAFYYQINYRTYEKGTAVRSFAAKDLEDLAASISVVQGALSTPPKQAAEPVLLFKGDIAAGASMSKGLPFGPSALNRLWLTVDAEDTEDALRTIVLKMTFDGEETVWCPLSDFFLSGVGFNAFDSWYSAAKGTNQLISRWTMPYRQRATVTLENLGSKPATVTLAHRTAAWNWDERSMHFWSRWRQERPIHTRPMSDFNYVEISGQGVYVGDGLTIFNPVPEWWGEGDEKIYVDGEAFPSHFGTGTEDYYGYAWSSPLKFQHAFHGQTRSDGEALKNTRGYSSVFRTRSLDAIPFTTGLKMDMEIWHWVECDVGYSTPTFFYALPGAKTNRPPLPAEAAKGVLPVPPPPPPFRVEGAVECEQMIVRSAEKAETTPQDMQGFGRNQWSNDGQLWVKGAGPGSAVEIELPAPGTAAQRLTLYATRSWDYGIVKITVNGSAAQGAAGTGLDLYSGQQGVAKPTGPVELGAFEPKDGKYIVRMEITGANPKATAPGAYFGVDCIALTPVAAPPAK